MNGIIYKITCKVTNKVYIGQTIRPLADRVARHFEDAEKCDHPGIHFQRAIRKYGRDAFIAEKIDEAHTRQELDEKEKYWISYYNSTVNGYNSTPGGEGGNTYLKKTEAEMAEIKEKISKSNTGRNNGMSTPIKAKSVKTGEEHIFGSLNEALRFFKMKGKSFIGERLGGKKTLWHHEWMFAYENDDYGNYIDDTPLSRRHGTKVKLSKDGEIKEFDSKQLAINFLGYSTRASGALLNGATINGWFVSF